MDQDKYPQVYFRTNPRRPTVIATIVLVWVLLAGLFVAVGAQWWILAPFGLLTVPAIVEAVRGRQSELYMDDTSMGWSSSSGNELGLWISQIERADVRPRLDASRRVRLRLTTGEKATIPPDCVPPGPLLERALSARGVEVRRTFFGM